MSSGVPRARSIGPPLLIGAILLAFVVWAFRYFGNIMLLIEYRDWSNTGNIGAIFDLFSVSGTEFSRSFGMFVDASLAAAFGRLAYLHNGFQIMLLAGSGLLLVLALRRLFSDSPIIASAIALIFLLFSTPVLDSLTWQATILDKLCVFFSALALYVMARVDIRNTRLTQIICVNLGVLAVVMAAYNSKESASALVPSLLLLVVVRGLDQSTNARKVAAAVLNACKLLALPLAYAIFHMAVVLHALLTNPGQQRHDVGGPVAFNAYHFAAYLLNLVPILGKWGAWPYAPGRVLFAFLVIAALAVIVITAAMFRFGGRRLSFYWIWALVSFGMSFAISARAIGIGAYYMLVPQLYLTICLFIAILALLKATRENAGMALAAQAGALVLCAVYLFGFAAYTKDYMKTSEMSDNFTSALHQVNTYIRAHPPAGRVDFMWPRSSDWNAYMFIGIPNSHGLAPYLTDSTSGSVIADLERRITDEQYTVNADISTRKSDIVVILGQHLQLVRIVPAH